ncbi:multidrug transporter [Marinomonas primoryensis]|uniref:Multidrug transporter n=1 Tax=Marinomonas primoryensis TaxID=178399 RepID=A0A2Z4PQQ7_9GAMM|nr:efflux RND transporter permease subunit [Marinomonas primoryensis]AWX99865.1 multidrug transporter [Marinomonas primoryensis]
MNALTSWFIRNPVAANLMMVLIFIAGWLTVSSIRVEGFPKLPADTLEITTIYPNVHVQQVDQQITRKIEKSIEGLVGIKKISSFSSEGTSSVSVQKQDGYPLDRLSNDIRTRLDSIYGLPEKSEKPIITRNDFDLPAMIVQLYGNIDTDTLQKTAGDIREALLALPEVSKIKTWGMRQPEIRIELIPEKMQAYDLSPSFVISSIQQSSLSFQAGSLKTIGGSIALRANSERLNRIDFEKIFIKSLKDGRSILLSEVAHIIDDYEDNESIVRFNGQAGIGMEILIGRKDNLLDIAAAVKKSISEQRLTLPNEIKLVSWADSSHYITERLDLLKDNAVQGLLLVFILLALFLNIKLAFWVAVGIPISVAGALAVMGSNWVGYSLNDITTFGLIIALGILVDDAIVVGESVFEERKKIKNPIKGTENGVRKVATATIYGVLTTIAAFFPMLLIDNAMGKILASFAGVVILTLIFSLFESKFILPSHLAAIDLDDVPFDNTKKIYPFTLLRRLGRCIQRYAQNSLEFFKIRIYQSVLKFSITHRYAVLVLFIAIAILGVGLISKGIIRTVFFPDIPGQIITVKIEMDSRSPLKLTTDNAEHVEQIISRLNQQWMDTYNLNDLPVKHVLTVVNGASSVEIYAELTPPSDRKQLSSIYMTEQWREKSGRLEGATELSFNASEQTGGGFAVQVMGKNDTALRKASKLIIERLQSISGVSNVRQDLSPGRPQLSLTLKVDAKHLGFTEEYLASQIAGHFGGSEAIRIQRGSQEVRVKVQDMKSSRDALSDLFNMRVIDQKGIWFPITTIADIQSSYITGYVSRRDGKRINTIYANLNKAYISPSELGSDIFGSFSAQIEAQFPSVKIQEAGELEEIFNVKGNLSKALLFTCFLIYGLLAIPLKSYIKPLIIMSVIPFGIVGAVLGHFIMDVPLSLLSFFGMLALTGVVVNDSLVMLVQYNHSRIEGMTVSKAINDAGLGRFKAIFLTTVTTAAGLTPLMLETSEQAQYLIPAAISLVFGEIFATLITLIIIPILIAISNDIKVFWLGEKK